MLACAVVRVRVRRVRSVAADVVVAKDRREEPEGHPDDFHESLCLMPERDFGGGKKKKRRERGRKDGNWTNQPRGGTTRRTVERGIRIDVDEF